MTSIAYSHALVAGTPENISDVQAMFDDAKNVINGNIDATNMAASARPATILGIYRRIGAAHGAASVTSANTWLSIDASQYSISGSAAAGITGVNSITIDSTLLPSVSGLTPKLRLYVVMVCNATAPAATYTWGLYPFTSSGAYPNQVITAGTVVSGSTVAVASPGASVTTTASTSDFTLPANGNYTLGFVSSGAAAGNCLISGNAFLEMRWV